MHFASSFGEGIIEVFGVKQIIFHVIGKKQHLCLRQPVKLRITPRKLDCSKTQLLQVAYLFIELT